MAFSGRVGEPRQHSSHHQANVVVCARNSPVRFGSAVIVPQIRKVFTGMKIADLQTHRPRQGISLSRDVDPSSVKHAQIRKVGR